MSVAVDKLIVISAVLLLLLGSSMLYLNILQQQHPESRPLQVVDQYVVSFRSSLSELQETMYSYGRVIWKGDEGAAPNRPTAATIDIWKESAYPVSPHSMKSFVNSMRRMFASLIERVATINRTVKTIINKFRSTAVQPVRNSRGSVGGKSVTVEDRVECDISKVGLTLQQEEKVRAVHSEILTGSSKGRDLNVEETIQAAAETHFLLSPHLVYRYFTSVDWSDMYNGKPMAEAVVHTVAWRKQFGIHKIDPFSNSSRLFQMVANGFAYTEDLPDKQKRAVMYLKVDRNIERESDEDYLNLLMYTVERADRMSVQFGSGGFVAIVDLDEFTWEKCPPVNFMQQAIMLLRRHYPYRLSGVYIMNAGATFNFLFNLLKPLMPKKALGKTFVLSKGESKKFLSEHVGLENVEIGYGGQRPTAFPGYDERSKPQQRQKQQKQQLLEREVDATDAADSRTIATAASTATATFYDSKGRKSVFSQAEYERKVVDYFARGYWAVNQRSSFFSR